MLNVGVCAQSLASSVTSIPPLSPQSRLAIHSPLLRPRVRPLLGEYSGVEDFDKIAKGGGIGVVVDCCS